MNFFVARHGQALWNAQNRVGGLSDIGLTEEGVKQAHLLALEVEEKDIDLIISSPL